MGHGEMGGRLAGPLDRELGHARKRKSGGGWAGLGWLQGELGFGPSSSRI
jgi:hypothetical protein